MASESSSPSLRRTVVSSRNETTRDQSSMSRVTSALLGALCLRAGPEPEPGADAANSNLASQSVVKMMASSPANVPKKTMRAGRAPPSRQPSAAGSASLHLTSIATCSNDGSAVWVALKRRVEADRRGSAAMMTTEDGGLEIALPYLSYLARMEEADGKRHIKVGCSELDADATTWADLLSLLVKQHQHFRHTLADVAKTLLPMSTSGNTGSTVGTVDILNARMCIPLDHLPGDLALSISAAVSCDHSTGALLPFLKLELEEGATRDISCLNLRANPPDDSLEIAGRDGSAGSLPKHQPTRLDQSTRSLQPAASAGAVAPFDRQDSLGLECVLSLLPDMLLVVDLDPACLSKSPVGRVLWQNESAVRFFRDLSKPHSSGEPANQAQSSQASSGMEMLEMLFRDKPGELGRLLGALDTCLRRFGPAGALNRSVDSRASDAALFFSCALNSSIRRAHADSHSQQGVDERRSASSARPSATDAVSMSLTSLSMALRSLRVVVPTSSPAFARIFQPAKPDMRTRGLSLDVGPVALLFRSQARTSQSNDVPDSLQRTRQRANVGAKHLGMVDLMKALESVLSNIDEDLSSGPAMDLRSAPQLWRDVADIAAQTAAGQIHDLDLLPGRAVPVPVSLPPPPPATTAPRTVGQPRHGVLSIPPQGPPERRHQSQSSFQSQVASESRNVVLNEDQQSFSGSWAIPSLARAGSMWSQPCLARQPSSRLMDMLNLKVTLGSFGSRSHSGLGFGRGSSQEASLPSDPSNALGHSVSGLAAAKAAAAAPSSLSPAAASLGPPKDTHRLSKSADPAGPALHAVHSPTPTLAPHSPPERRLELKAFLKSHPGTGQPFLLLCVSDVTERAFFEQAVVELAESQLNMLDGMFPSFVLKHMLGGGSALNDPQRFARHHDQVSILFMDIVGFTSMSEASPAEEVMSFLGVLFSGFDVLCDKHSVYKVETAGDCYIVAGALHNPDGTEDTKTEPQAGLHNILAFAHDMVEHASTVKMPTGKSTTIRVGIHTGPLVSGVIGTKLPKYGLFGDTMNTSSRIESTAPPGRIQISEASFSLLGDSQKQGFKPTGGVMIKGKGVMQTYINATSGDSAFSGAQ